MFKRIFATVSEKEFNAFRTLCYLNVVKMGECLSEMIREYIKENQKQHKDEHHAPTGADYKKEHTE